MDSNGENTSGAIGRRRPLTTSRRASPLRAERVNTHRRLIDAEARLDNVRARRGLADTAITDVLDAIESGDDRIAPEDDLYLRTLSEYVAQLSGHIHVQAVFPDETVMLLRQADPTGS
jgi:hypothetical protein